jgi:hypothetical protein
MDNNGVEDVFNIFDECLSRDLLNFSFDSVDPEKFNRMVIYLKKVMKFINSEDRMEPPWIYLHGKAPLSELYPGEELYPELDYSVYNQEEFDEQTYIRFSKKRKSFRIVYEITDGFIHRFVIKEIKHYDELMAVIDFYEKHNGYNCRCRRYF